MPQIAAVIPLQQPLEQIVILAQARVAIPEGGQSPDTPASRVTPAQQPQDMVAPRDSIRVRLQNLRDCLVGPAQYTAFAACVSLSLGCVLAGIQSVAAPSNSEETSNPSFLDMMQKTALSSFCMFMIGGIAIYFVSNNVGGFDLHDGNPEEPDVHPMPEDLRHLMLPTQLTTEQSQRAQALVARGAEQDFPFARVSIDADATCPISMMSVFPLDEEQGVAEVIQKPVVIAYTSQQQQRGNEVQVFPFVFEQDALLTAWVLRGKDPTNRQEFDLDQIRTAVIEV